MSIIKRTELRDKIKEILNNENEYNHRYYDKNDGEVGRTGEEIEGIDDFSWLADKYVEAKQANIVIVNTSEGSYFNEEPSNIELINDSLEGDQEYTDLVDNSGPPYFKDLSDSEVADMEIGEIETKTFKREASGQFFADLEKHVLVGAALYDILIEKIEDLSDRMDALE